MAELGRNRLDVRPGLHLASHDAIWKRQYRAIAEEPQALPDPLRARDYPGSLLQIDQVPASS